MAWVIGGEERRFVFISYYRFIFQLLTKPLRFLDFCAQEVSGLIDTHTVSVNTCTWRWLLTGHIPRTTRDQ